MKSINFLVTLLLIIVITACVPGSSPQATIQANRPITVCYSAITGTQAVTWYAYEKGIYNKYGLDVNMVYITSGTKAVTAMIAGDVNICASAGSAVVNAIAAGQDVVMIAGMYNLYPASLVVNKNIMSPADLIGKSVAISQIGSSTDAGARIALKSLKLVPDKDVAIIPIGDESERLKAMEAGQVAGAILTTPTTIIAYDMGYKEIVNLAEINVAYQHTGYVTTRSFISSHPAEVESFLKATIEAISLMKKDEEGSIAVMAQYMLLDPVKDARPLEDAYHKLILESLSAKPYPTLEGIQTLIDLSAPSNPTILNVTPAQVVDTSILDRIYSSGFDDTLK